MRKFFVLCALWLLFCSANVWALGAEGAIGFWSADIDGWLSYKGNSLSSDDLGFDQVNKAYARVKLDLPLINFYFMFTPVCFAGTGQKSTPFRFGDYTFSANTKFSSQFKINQYDFGLYWGIPLLKSATKLATLGQFGMNLEFGFDIKAINVDTKITQLNITKEKNFTIPVPLLYAAIDIEVWKLAFEAEGRGISFDGHYFYDAIGRVKFNVIKLPVVAALFVEGGYRYQKIKFNDLEDLLGEVEISGPFLGIAGSF